MSQKQEIFEKVLSLVRNELWGEPLTCAISAEEIEGILKVAKEQAVSGLVANAIVSQHLPIGEDMTMEVCAIQRLHEKKNREMNAEIAQFAGFLNRRNLAYVIMKGQTMAALYPNPLMRSSGDIDFYCPKNSFDAVQQAIEERLGIVMKHNGSERHDTFRINGYSFEMHSDLTIFNAPSHQKYWEHFIDDAFKAESHQVSIGGESVPVLAPTVDAVFIFAHLIGHFMETGLGMKQLCDWAMVLHRHRDVIDKRRLDDCLTGIGLKKAYLCVGAWLVEKLGFPENEFPFPLTAKNKSWVEPLHANLMKMRAVGIDLDDKVGHRVSFMHSLGTAMIVARQTLRFLPLAPKEMLWRFPVMASWSIKKRMIS